MLDLDLVTVLAEIINFLVLAVALYFLFFKPLMKRVEKRTQEKEALLEEAYQKQRQAEEELAIIDNRLSNIDTEIEARLQDAYKQAQVESQSLLDATQEEAERILSEAQIEAEKRQKQEIEELQKELVQTILNISGQVLLRTAPEMIHDKLVEELNAEIWDLGKTDMRQVRTIRDSLSERTPSVLVTSAKELSLEHQRLLIKTFSALADTNVNMEIDLDPDLIAGIRVRMGDLVVENTLAMELNELSSDVIGSLERTADVSQ